MKVISITFQGAVESISVGEIKLSPQKSLVEFGLSVISREPKLELLISEFEIILSSSAQSTKKKKKSQTRRPHSGGKGKWMVFANFARFLSVHVIEINVKVCFCC